MTPADIDRLLELEEEATPGPLQVMPGARSNLVHVETGEGNPIGQGVPICSMPKKREADAELLAEARNLIRPLAEQARRVPELEAAFIQRDEALQREEDRAEQAESALAAAREENERLRGLVRGFLDCPEIADCAPEDRDPETDALERQARAALAKEPQA